MTSFDLRRYIDLLGAPLMEAQNYGDMFNDLRRIVAPDAHLLAAVDEQVAQIIPDARKSLRKNDRVVWFLRYWKMGFVHRLFSSFPMEPDLQKGILSGLSALRDRLVDEMVRRSGESRDYVFHSLMVAYGHRRATLDMFQHFLSLPIPAIANQAFAFQSVQTLKDQFGDAEAEWQKKHEGTLAHDPEDGETVLSFPDGLYWQLLDRPYCDDEGRAMGHCGNEAAWREGDRLLSLRRDVTEGGHTRTRPSLTFILHSDGKLGEMKGRANTKPASKYHPHIVALLKLPLIKGIQGGGYAPEQNFDLADLPKDEFAALIAEKPALHGPTIFTDGGFSVHSSDPYRMIFANGGAIAGSMETEHHYGDLNLLSIKYDEDVAGSVEGFLAREFSDADRLFWERVPDEVNHYAKDRDRLMYAIQNWDRRDASKLETMLQEFEEAAHYTATPNLEVDSIPSYPAPFGKDGDGILAFDQHGDFLSIHGYAFRSLEKWIEAHGSADQQIAFHLWQSGQQPIVKTIRDMASELGLDRDEVDFEEVKRLLREHIAAYGEWED